MNQILEEGKDNSLAVHKCYKSRSREISALVETVLHLILLCVVFFHFTDPLENMVTGEPLLA